MTAVLADLFDQADDDVDEVVVARPHQAPCPTGQHAAAVVEKQPCGCTEADAAAASCRHCQGATTARGLVSRGHVDRSGKWCTRP